MKKIIANFIKYHMDYLEFANKLMLKALSANSYLICGDDCRLGMWVEHHQQDFIELGEQNNFDIHVLIEQMEQFDTSPGVYVIISKHGDKSGLREVEKIEKGREGVYLSEIDKIPDFDDFIKKSELSKVLLENASEVYSIHEYSTKPEAAVSYSTLGWDLDDAEDVRTQDNEDSAKTEPKTQMVELTIVGIRNYCIGGEAGLPAMFDRLPNGSTLYLKVDPAGTEFPGAVAVYDGLGDKIGYVMKTDRRFIKLAIPKDGMLPCKVIGHSMEDRCLYVEAENSVGYEEPHIRQASVESGELIFLAHLQNPVF